MSNLNDDAENILKQWALWSTAHTGINIRFPSIAPFTKMIAEHGKESTRLTDEEAMKVDRIVADLIESHPDEGKFLFLYYCCNKQNFSKTCDEMKVTAKKGEGMLGYAIGVVAGRLFDKVA